MFEDVYDGLSFCWSWHWPRCGGEITAVDVERKPDTNGNVALRLAVAYKFSSGDDGPYTGESFWQPAFCVNKGVIAARRKMRIPQKVIVCYRPDDPSVNRLDRGVWRGL
jgi:hypothetical protein